MAKQGQSEKETARCELCGTPIDEHNEGMDGYCKSCCEDAGSCCPEFGGFDHTKDASED